MHPPMLTTTMCQSQSWTLYRCLMTRTHSPGYKLDVDLPSVSVSGTPC